jgi:hypothetical protein
MVGANASALNMAFTRHCSRTFDIFEILGKGDPAYAPHFVRTNLVDRVMPPLELAHV